jgi:hypothetical protein
MAIICRSYALLFLMAPRTACSAVGQLLCEELEGEYIPRETVLDESGRSVADFKHTTLKQLLTHGLLLEEEAASLFKFTTVRNPFDSLVSQYLKHRHKHPAILEREGSWIHAMPQRYIEGVRYCEEHTFEEWIVWRYSQPVLSRRWLRPPRRLLYGRFTAGADYVMRYERLQQDFDEALQRAGAQRRYTVPHVNPTKGKVEDYRAYYTSRTRKIVEYAFSHDMKRYGYAF